MSGKTFLDGKEIIVSPIISSGLTIQSGALTLPQGGTISDDADKITILAPDGDYARIGDAGTPTQSLGTDDFFCSKHIEVASKIYGYGIATFYSNLVLNSTSSYFHLGGTSVSSSYSSFRCGVDDGLRWGVQDTDGAANHHIIITSSDNILSDHDHDTLSAYPKILIHDETDPDTDNTIFATLAHNQVGITGTKGSYSDHLTATEEVTISVGQGAGGVNTSGNLAPANALIKYITTRVTDAPGGGATEFDVGITGSGNQDALIDGSAVALDTTANSVADNDSTQLPIANGSATTLTITTDANVTGDEMKVRIVVFYDQITAPTS